MSSPLAQRRAGRGARAPAALHSSGSRRLTIRVTESPRGAAGSPKGAAEKDYGAMGEKAAIVDAGVGDAGQRGPALRLSPTHSHAAATAGKSAQARAPARATGVAGAASPKGGGASAKSGAGPGLRRAALAASVFLAYADTALDALVASTLFGAGHGGWAAACAVFVVTTPFVLACYKLGSVIFLAGAGGGRAAGADGRHTRVVTPSGSAGARAVAWSDAPAAGGSPLSRGGFVEPGAGAERRGGGVVDVCLGLASAAASVLGLDTLLSGVAAWRRSAARGWAADPLSLDLGSKWLLGVGDCRFAHAVGQALPQFLLQGYVFLVLRISHGTSYALSPWSMLLQIASLASSALSLAITVAHFRLSMPRARPTPARVVNVVAWTFAETSVKGLGLAFMGAAFQGWALAAVLAVVILKFLVVCTTMPRYGWGDRFMYLALASVLYFHVEPRGPACASSRRLMFAVDGLAALAFLVLPLISSLRPAVDDPMVPSPEQVIIGTCPEDMGGWTCMGFPPSYIVNYLLLFSVCCACYSVHESGLLPAPDVVSPRQRSRRAGFCGAVRDVLCALCPCASQRRLAGKKSFSKVVAIRHKRGVNGSWNEHAGALRQSTAAEVSRSGGGDNDDDDTSTTASSEKNPADQEYDVGGGDRGDDTASITEGVGHLTHAAADDELSGEVELKRSSWSFSEYDLTTPLGARQQQSGGAAEVARRHVMGSSSSHSGGYHRHHHPPPHHGSRGLTPTSGAASSRRSRASSHGSWEGGTASDGTGTQHDVVGAHRYLYVANHQPHSNVAAHEELHSRHVADAHSKMRKQRSLRSLLRRRGSAGAMSFVSDDTPLSARLSIYSIDEDDAPALAELRVASHSNLSSPANSPAMSPAMSPARSPTRSPKGYQPTRTSLERARDRAREAERELELQRRRVRSGELVPRWFFDDVIDDDDDDEGDSMCLLDDDDREGDSDASSLGSFSSLSSDDDDDELHAASRAHGQSSPLRRGLGSGSFASPKHGSYGSPKHGSYGSPKYGSYGSPKHGTFASPKYGGGSPASGRISVASIADAAGEFGRY